MSGKTRFNKLKPDNEKKKEKISSPVMFLATLETSAIERTAGEKRRDSNFFPIRSLFFQALASPMLKITSVLAVKLKPEKRLLPKKRLRPIHILQIQFQDGKTTVPNRRLLHPLPPLFSPPVYCFLFTVQKCSFVHPWKLARKKKWMTPQSRMCCMKLLRF